MIIRGGENIFPKEIEDFLFEHPAIAQAQVFGIPDETYGEIVCAWVLLNNDATLTEAELRDWCKDKIAHFKVPAVVRFPEALPMTVTGKPQKFLMREAMLQERGKS
jgi:fatty-acyl-CoA synthase